MPSRLISRVAAAMAALLLTTSCTDDHHAALTAPDGRTTASTERARTEELAGAPHGYVKGAEETAEAQVGLAFAQTGDRQVSVLDLATERTTAIPLALEAVTMVEDGRYLYVGDGRHEIEILDTGVWTVDHGDHVHYYRAPATSRGVLDLAAPVVSVVGHGARTTIGTTDGRVTVLDREALASGGPEVTAVLETDAARPFAVPFDEDLLLATTTAIVTVDANGRRTGEPDAPCSNPDGWAILRSGVAIGCDDGVLLVKRPDGRQQTFLLPYPVDAPRATAFENRPRSNEAAATAGNAGVWSIDANHERLTFTATSDAAVIAAASPADERHVLYLDEAGAVHLATLSGERTATADVLAPGASSPIRLDTARTYIADTEARRALELAHGDALRVSRTFALDVRPELFVEVGR